MADKARRLTDEKLAKMEKHLSAVYSSVEKEIKDILIKKSQPFHEIADGLLERVKTSNTDKERKKAEKEYISFIKKEFVKSKDFKKVIEKLSVKFYETNKQSAEYINSQTPEIYQINYNSIGKSLQEDLVDYYFEDVSIEEILEYGNITKQTVSKEKDVKWNNKNFTKSILAGALLLLSVNQIVKRASKNVSNKNKNGAITHVGDMVTDAASKGSLDSMYMAEASGYESIKKVWMTAGDNRVRESHRDLDGVEVALDDLFPNGLSRPRDPNGASSEIYNCRCDLDYDVGQKKSRTRSARIGEVTGSYKKSSSFAGTESVEAPNISYKELMKWLKHR